MIAFVENASKSIISLRPQYARKNRPQKIKYLTSVLRYSIVYPHH